MRLRFFTVRIHGDDEAVAELDRFLGSRRILAIDRQFIANGANSAWALCVTFDEADPSVRGGSAVAARRGKVDYREQFTEPEFAVFSRLRALRKKMADAEGVPAFALFSNEQLAEMVRRRVTSASARAALASVRSFLSERLRLTVKSPARVGHSRYGLMFCGYRVLPGRLMLSRRRRRRYGALRREAERSALEGRLDARGLQSAYASALGLTAHVDASAWRREQLRRSPVDPVLEAL